MTASLVKCPICKNRHRLVSIKVVRKEDIRRFRCDKCGKDTEYIVGLGAAQVLECSPSASQ